MLIGRAAKFVGLYSISVPISQLFRAPKHYIYQNLVKISSLADRDSARMLDLKYSHLRGSVVCTTYRPY